ncbi:response regulator transcription factor [Paenibacillus thalictri]|uniref:Response regulator n=1 Tax=Paenibacillus thalictri TaxID=2527873 RepID=A0A4Q9DGE8_9BACL|nr:response regulator [Paenibacillus thalictri]TBL68272.1 response regulator [Paenibacillus thalictri]
MYRVLLIEDEPLIRQGIRKLIEQLPQDFAVVKEADHGLEALEYMNGAPGAVDIVVTDIRMREMDGLSFIHKLREHDEVLPIMIISGYGDFQYAQQALRYGVSDYLLKPINRLSFISSLEKIRDKLDKAGGRGVAVKEADKTEHAEAPLDKDHRIIRKVKDYIMANVAGDLSLQAISAHVELHPVYLSHLFKQEAGYNLSEYITETRIDRAKQLLTATELKIYDVARLAGYQSPKHFALVFKQLTGVTPMAYRGAHRA